MEPKELQRRLAKLDKELAQADCPLAATACYRALLPDMLNHVRGKRCIATQPRIASKLNVFADRINGYAHLDVHQAFLAQPDKDQGRKQSFRARVNP